MGKIDPVVRAVSHLTGIRLFQSKGGEWLVQTEGGTPFPASPYEVWLWLRILELESAMMKGKQVGDGAQIRH